MGYVCPVCTAGVADGRQLADHLAVTASLGREDHRAWLETHAPDWGDSTPAELAERVTEYATELDLPVSDDAPEGPAGRPQGPRLEDALAEQSTGPGRGDLTGDAQSILEEAMELTREMEQSDERAKGSGSSDDE
ncbi:DUF5810 domain-containing protein [Natrialbaceae archaeon A-chndr2]